MDNLIVSYIRRLGPFFFGGGGGSKFEILIFLDFFRKLNNCLGMKNLILFLGCHHKSGLYFGPLLCILGSFLRIKVGNGNIFWELLKFQIFLRVCLIFLILFFIIIIIIIIIYLFFFIWGTGGNQ